MLAQWNFWERPKPTRGECMQKHHVWSNALFLFNNFTYFSPFQSSFIFPSLYFTRYRSRQYLVFRWNLPPTLSCIPKQSWLFEKVHKEKVSRQTGFSPPWRPVPRNIDKDLIKRQFYKLHPWVIVELPVKRRQWKRLYRTQDRHGSYDR